MSIKNNKRLFSDSRTRKGHKSREIETVNVWMRAGLVVGRDGAVAAPGTASLDPAVRDGYSVCLGVRVHEQEDEREDDLGHTTLCQRSSSTKMYKTYTSRTAYAITSASTEIRFAPSVRAKTIG